MKNKILTICIFIILLTTYVSAFGVASFYYKGNPLIMNPGDIKEIQLILQNEKTSEPITLKSEITAGSEIAEITGRTMFDLNSGQDDVNVNIKITIPETAEIGKEYSVGTTFTTFSRKDQGMLSMGTQISKAIPIVIGKVVQKQEPKTSLKDIIPSGAMAPIILILIVLIYMFYKRKQKK